MPFCFEVPCYISSPLPVSLTPTLLCLFFRRGAARLVPRAGLTAVHGIYATVLFILFTSCYYFYFIHFFICHPPLDSTSNGLSAGASHRIHPHPFFLRVLKRSRAYLPPLGARLRCNYGVHCRTRPRLESCRHPREPQPHPEGGACAGFVLRRVPKSWRHLRRGEWRQ